MWTYERSVYIMRRLPKWLIILAVVVLVCTGVKLWYDRLSFGEIDISNSAPSKEMLLHILEHTEELAARPELFEVDIMGDDILVSYIGNPAYEYANIRYFPDAAAVLADPTSSLNVSAHYFRNNYSDFWDIVLPWSSLNLNFLIEERPGSYVWLNIQDDGAPAVSDAPLREMLHAITSVIGTP